MKIDQIIMTRPRSEPIFYSYLSQNLQKESAKSTLCLSLLPLVLFSNQNIASILICIKSNITRVSYSIDKTYLDIYSHHDIQTYSSCTTHAKLATVMLQELKAKVKRVSKSELKIDPLLTLLIWHWENAAFPGTNLTVSCDEVMDPLAFNRSMTEQFIFAF